MVVETILAPLINNNEPEVRVAAIHALDGKNVKKGDLLFSVETTKATSEINSPASGYFRLKVKEGDLLAVGEILAFITSTLEPVQGVSSVTKTSLEETNLRITQPARDLAERLGISLANLPTDKLVTEESIRKMVNKPIGNLSLGGKIDPERSIVIYGGGGHAKSVIELIRSSLPFEIAGIIDDQIPAGTIVLGLQVLGNREILPEVRKQGVKLAANGVGGIIDIKIREELCQLLEEEGFSFPSLIHRTATVEKSATIKNGALVFANAYVGAEAVVSEHAMVNTNAVVSHDCQVGKFSHVAPGALLAGHVTVGEKSLVGMGVTTSIGIHIEDHVRIGNGAILLADVPSHTLISTGKIWQGIK